MKSRRILVLVPVLAGSLFAFAGCSPAHLYSSSAGFSRASTVTVRVDATPNALRAIAWWNDLAGRPLFVVTTAADAQVTIEPDAGACGPVTTDRVACTTVLPASGTFSDPPTYVYNVCTIGISALGATYWEVYAHELGHCLGFAHVADRDSIMNPHPVSGNAIADRSMLGAAGYR